MKESYKPKRSSPESAVVSEAILHEAREFEGVRSALALYAQSHDVVCEITERTDSVVLSFDKEYFGIFLPELKTILENANRALEHAHATRRIITEIRADGIHVKLVSK
jgi:hypothetical protein